MYEFLYRAISDYVDLYKNKDEEYEYSVPVGTVPNNGTTKVINFIIWNGTWFNVLLSFSSRPSQSSQPNPWNPMDRVPTVFQLDQMEQELLDQDRTQVLADIYPRGRRRQGWHKKTKYNRKAYVMCHQLSSKVLTFMKTMSLMKQKSRKIWSMMMKLTLN